MKSTTEMTNSELEEWIISASDELVIKFGKFDESDSIDECLSAMRGGNREGLIDCANYASSLVIQARLESTRKKYPNGWLEESEDNGCFILISSIIIGFVIGLFLLLIEVQT